MLRSDLCDFNDAYIVVEGRIAASFNPRQDYYGAKDFPDNLFPNKFFLPGRTAEQITVARNAAKTAAVYATSDVANDTRNLSKSIFLKSDASFICCISKINGTLTDNVEDSDVIICMYNLLEYSKHYRKTIGSLWNYCRDEPISDSRINHYLGWKSFDLKLSIMGGFGDINDDSQANKDKIRFAASLKQLSDFWRSLKMPLINQ